MFARGFLPVAVVGRCERPEHVTGCTPGSVVGPRTLGPFTTRTIHVSP
jgi:hypothetical protein